MLMPVAYSAESNIHFKKILRFKNMMLFLYSSQTLSKAWQPSESLEKKTLSFSKLEKINMRDFGIKINFFEYL